MGPRRASHGTTPGSTSDGAATCEVATRPTAAGTPFDKPPPRSSELHAKVHTTTELAIFAQLHGRLHSGNFPECTFS